MVGVLPRDIDSWDDPTCPECGFQRRRIYIPRYAKAPDGSWVDSYEFRCDTPDCSKNPRPLYILEDKVNG